MIIFNGKKIGDVRYGKIKAREVRVGTRLVWSAGKYLSVAPDTLWLTKDNAYTSEFDVKSNTDWSIT